MDDLLSILTTVAKEAGLFGSFETSTIGLAKALDTSQQTMSRKLIQMEKSGLIERRATARGVELRLTTRGREIVSKWYQELDAVFRKRDQGISGTVISGVQEGNYYVSQEEYQRQFAEKLGFRAFPGTLNLKVNPDELPKLTNKNPIRIEGFSKEGRTFGGLTCYKAKLKFQRVAIAIPDRTTHGKDIMEVISPINLKEALGIKDGYEVKVVPL